MDMLLATIASSRRRFVGLLDLYPGAAAAYSLRALRASWMGSAVVRVRRSSDNAESDFTAAQISDGTLTTWTGANNGFVVTWYDQSGNARNATQATAGNQPRIVNAGVLETGETGKPCVRFLNLAPLTATWSQAQPFTAFTLSSAEQTNATDAILGFGGNNSSYYTNAGAHGIFAGTALTGGSYTANDPQIKYALYNGASSEFRLNGGAAISGNAGAASASALSLGGVGTFSLTGRISEAIAYPSNQSANRAGIEANINSHYGIY